MLRRRRRGSQRDALGAMGVVTLVGEVGADGRHALTRIGAGATALLGEQPSARIGARAWEEAVHPDDRARYAGLFATPSADTDEITLEYRLIGADGRTRWVRESAVRRRTGAGRLRIERAATEVTAAHRIDEELAATAETLAAVFEATGTYAYVAELGADGALHGQFGGPAFDRLVGTTGGDGDARDAYLARIHPDDRYRALADRAALRRLEQQTLTYRLVDGGEERHVVEHMRPRPGPGGRTMVDGIVTDVTAQNARERELQAAVDEARRAAASAESQALLDPLTRIGNRRRAELELDGLARALRAGGRPYGVLVLDVDYFKLVNDTYGHRAGDEVLTEVARRLAAVAEPDGAVSRWGGEEFCVVVPHVEGDDGLRALGERLRSAIGDRAFPVAGRTHPLTLSVGAAAAHSAEESGDALLDAADRALYSGKRRGRNQVRLFADLGSEDLALQEPEPLRVAQALALSVAVREGSDPLHSHQVADLSMKLARELGLPPAAIIRCQLAGWLHDAGKVALPDDILRKPGPLDPEQWEIVRNHPLIGEQLVRRIAGLADAAPVIRHHHERYDGTGYPDGLVGDQTPVEARVLAIANAYAAITADRVYAAGVPQDQALEAIEAEAGRQFDPSIARLLRRVIEADRSRVEAVISDDDRLAC